MKTYKLTTFSQVISVKNCSCYAEALHKAGLFDSEVVEYYAVNQ